MNKGQAIKGRGAGKDPTGPFDEREYVQEDPDGLDEAWQEDTPTRYIPVYPKRIVHEVDSPDLGHCYSMNPYQGCEHGCVYCYARNTHPYWGYSAGLDFERKVLVKEKAPELLTQQLSAPDWRPMPLMFSGNTDCYQPVEKEKRITRRLLGVLQRFRHPAGLITKNRLITRDIDILRDMAAHDLLHVNISLTTMNEALRQRLEPRTASGPQRLKTIRELANAGIPVNVMLAPIIPSLNGEEIPRLVEEAANNGARSVAYTVVRLNGDLADLFRDWLDEHYPERADKVMAQVAECHGGRVNDSRFGTRLKGEGAVAEALSSLFRVAKTRHFGERPGMPPLNLEAFNNGHGKQLGLF